MIQKKSPRGEFHILTKCVALLVCLCMVTMDVAYAAPPSSLRGSEATEAIPANEIASSALRPPRNDAFIIPPSLGTLEESHTGTNGQTILFIQDAHDSLEAQENIAKIIEYLVEHHGVRTVFEEGYEGAVPSDEYFGFIKDPEIKEKVSHDFMDALKIGGAEYAHINRKEDFELIGADRIDLHLENIEWYRQSAIRREQIENDLREIEKHIEKLSNQYFSKEMKEWMKLKKRYEEGKLDVVEYLKRILSLRVSEGGEAISKTGLLRRILEPSRPTGPSDPMGPKGNDGLNFDPKTLFREIEAFENQLAEKLLETGPARDPSLVDRDRKIFEYHREIQLLKRLNQIEITSAEYAAIAGDGVTPPLQILFHTESLARFLAKHTKKSLLLSKHWESNIRHALRFYEIAEERDKVIEKTLKGARPMGLAPSETAILVFGGFHKENIKTILRRNGFSYSIISPKITEMSDKHQKRFRDLMAAGVPDFSISTVVKGAARYFPIYVPAEFLGRRAEVREQIQSTARRFGFRSEMRADSPKESAWHAPRPPEREEVRAHQDISHVQKLKEGIQEVESLRKQRSLEELKQALELTKGLLQDATRLIENPMQDYYLQIARHELTAIQKKLAILETEIKMEYQNKRYVPYALGVPIGILLSGVVLSVFNADSLNFLILMMASIPVSIGIIALSEWFFNRNKRNKEKQSQKTDSTSSPRSEVRVQDTWDDLKPWGPANPPPGLTTFTEAVQSYAADHNLESVELEEVLAWFQLQPFLDFGQDPSATYVRWLRLAGSSQAYGIGDMIDARITGLRDYLYSWPWNTIQWPLDERSKRIIFSYIIDEDLSPKSRRALHRGDWISYHNIIRNIRNTLTDHGLAFVDPAAFNSERLIKVIREDAELKFQKELHLDIVGGRWFISREPVRNTVAQMIREMKFVFAEEQARKERKDYLGQRLNLGAPQIHDLDISYMRSHKAILDNLRSVPSGHLLFMLKGLTTYSYDAVPNHFSSYRLDLESGHLLRGLPHPLLTAKQFPQVLSRALAEKLITDKTENEKREQLKFILEKSFENAFWNGNKLNLQLPLAIELKPLDGGGFRVRLYDTATKDGSRLEQARAARFLNSDQNHDLFGVRQELDLTFNGNFSVQYEQTEVYGGVTTILIHPSRSEARNSIIGEYESNVDDLSSLIQNLDQRPKFKKRIPGNYQVHQNLVRFLTELAESLSDSQISYQKIAARFGRFIESFLKTKSDKKVYFQVFKSVIQEPLNEQHDLSSYKFTNADIQQVIQFLRADPIEDLGVILFSHRVSTEPPAVEDKEQKNRLVMEVRWSEAEVELWEAAHRAYIEAGRYETLKRYSLMRGEPVPAFAQTFQGSDVLAEMPVREVELRNGDKRELAIVVGNDFRAEGLQSLDSAITGTRDLDLNMAPYYYGWSLLMAWRLERYAVSRNADYLIWPSHQDALRRGRRDHSAWQPGQSSMLFEQVPRSRGYRKINLASKFPGNNIVIDQGQVEEAWIKKINDSYPRDEVREQIQSAIRPTPAKKMLVQGVLPLVVLASGIGASFLTKSFEALPLSLIMIRIFQYTLGTLAEILMVMTANYIGQFRTPSLQESWIRAFRYSLVIQVAFWFWFILKPILRLTLDPFGPVMMVAADTFISLGISRLMLELIYRFERFSREEIRKNIRSKYWTMYGISSTVWGIVNLGIYGVPKDWAFVIPILSSVTAFLMAVTIGGLIWRKDLSGPAARFLGRVGVFAPIVSLGAMGTILGLQIDFLRAFFGMTIGLGVGALFVYPFAKNYLHYIRTEAAEEKRTKVQTDRRISQDTSLDEASRSEARKEAVTPGVLRREEGGVFGLLARRLEEGVRSVRQQARRLLEEHRLWSPIYPSIPAGAATSGASLRSTPLLRSEVRANRRRAFKQKSFGLSPKFKVDRRSRLSYQAALRDEIDHYLGRMEKIMKQDPWLFFNADQKQKEAAGAIGTALRHYLSEIKHHSRQGRLKSGDAALFKMRQAVRDLTMVLEILNLLRDGRLHEKPFEHELKRGEGYSRRFGYQWRPYGSAPVSYDVITLARWKEEKNVTPRFTLAVVEPKKDGREIKTHRDYRQIISFRLDYEQNGNQEASAAVNPPRSLARFLSIKQTHFPVRALKDQERFKSFVRELDQFLSRSETREDELSKIVISEELRAQILAKYPQAANYKDWEGRLDQIRKKLKAEPQEILEFFTEVPMLVTMNADNLRRRWKLLEEMKIPRRLRFPALKKIIFLNPDILELIIKHIIHSGYRMPSPDELRRIHDQLNQGVWIAHRKSAFDYMKETEFDPEKWQPVFEKLLKPIVSKVLFPRSEVRTKIHEDQFTLLLPGGGVHHLEMGRSLYDQYQTFRDIYDQANQIIRENPMLNSEDYFSPDFDVSIFTDPGDANRDELVQTLDEPLYYHVAHTVYLYALYHLLQEQGGKSFKAGAVLGNSLGFITALMIGGFLSLEDGIKLAAYQGKLGNQSLGIGTMAAIIGWNLERVEELAKKHGIEVSIDFGTDDLRPEGTQNIVIAGPAEPLQAAVREAKDSGAKAILYKTSLPGHSQWMAERSQQLREFLEAREIVLKDGDPSMIVMDTTTGKILRSKQEVFEELSEYLHETVHWTETTRTLRALGARRFLELSPGKAFLSKRVGSAEVERYHIRDAGSLELFLAHLSRSGRDPEDLRSETRDDFSKGKEHLEKMRLKVINDLGQIDYGDDFIAESTNIIILQPHGTTPWNEKGALQGRSADQAAGGEKNAKLNTYGIRQVRESSEELWNYQISAGAEDVVYLRSPAVRSRGSGIAVESVFNDHQESIQILKQRGLYEIDNGEWEGKTREELLELGIEASQRQQERDVFAKPDGETAENFAEFLWRIRNTLRELKSKFPDKKIVIVDASSGVIAAIKILIRHPDAEAVLREKGFLDWGKLGPARRDRNRLVYLEQGNHSLDRSEVRTEVTNPKKAKERKKIEKVLTEFLTDGKQYGVGPLLENGEYEWAGNELLVTSAIEPDCFECGMAAQAVARRLLAEGVNGMNVAIRFPISRSVQRNEDVSGAFYQQIYEINHVLLVTDEKHVIDPTVFKHPFARGNAPGVVQLEDHPWKTPIENAIQGHGKRGPVRFEDAPVREREAPFTYEYSEYPKSPQIGGYPLRILPVGDAQFLMSFLRYGFHRPQNGEFYIGINYQTENVVYRPAENLDQPLYEVPQSIIVSVYVPFQQLMAHQPEIRAAWQTGDPEVMHEQMRRLQGFGLAENFNDEKLRLSGALDQREQLDEMMMEDLKYLFAFLANLPEIDVRELEEKVRGEKPRRSEARVSGPLTEQERIKLEGHVLQLASDRKEVYLSYLADAHHVTHDFAAEVLEKYGYENKGITESGALYVPLITEDQEKALHAADPKLNNFERQRLNSLIGKVKELTREIRPRDHPEYKPFVFRETFSHKINSYSGSFRKTNEQHHLMELKRDADNLWALIKLLEEFLQHPPNEYLRTSPKMNAMIGAEQLPALIATAMFESASEEQFFSEHMDQIREVVRQLEWVHFTIARTLHTLKQRSFQGNPAELMIPEELDRPSVVDMESYLRIPEIEKIEEHLTQVYEKGREALSQNVQALLSDPESLNIDPAEMAELHAYYRGRLAADELSHEEYSHHLFDGLYNLILKLAITQARLDQTSDAYDRLIHYLPSFSNAEIAGLGHAAIEMRSNPLDTMSRFAGLLAKEDQVRGLFYQVLERINEFALADLRYRSQLDQKMAGFGDHHEYLMALRFIFNELVSANVPGIEEQSDEFRKTVRYVPETFLPRRLQQKWQESADLDPAQFVEQWFDFIINIELRGKEAGLVTDPWYAEEIYRNLSAAKVQGIEQADELWRHFRRRFIELSAQTPPRSETRGAEQTGSDPKMPGTLNTSRSEVRDAVAFKWKTGQDFPGEFENFIQAWKRWRHEQGMEPGDETSLILAKGQEKLELQKTTDKQVLLTYQKTDEALKKEITLSLEFIFAGPKKMTVFVNARSKTEGQFEDRLPREFLMFQAPAMPQVLESIRYENGVLEFNFDVSPESVRRVLLGLEMRSWLDQNGIVLEDKIRFKSIHDDESYPRSEVRVSGPLTEQVPRPQEWDEARSEVRSGQIKAEDLLKKWSQHHKFSDQVRVLPTSTGFVVQLDGRRIAEFHYSTPEKPNQFSALFFGEPFIKEPYRRKHLLLFMALAALDKNPRWEHMEMNPAMPAEILLMKALEKHGLIKNIRPSYRGIKADIDRIRMNEILENKDGVLDQWIQGPESVEGDIPYDDLFLDDHKLESQTVEWRKGSSPDKDLADGEKIELLRNKTWVVRLRFTEREEDGSEVVHEYDRMAGEFIRLNDGRLVSVISAHPQRVVVKVFSRSARSEVRVSGPLTEQVPRPQEWDEVRMAEPLTGRFHVILDLQGGITLGQLENDFEKVMYLHSKNLRLGFYNAAALEPKSEIRKRIQSLQQEFGIAHVMIWEGLPDESLSAFPGDFIQITGPRSEARFDLSQIIGNAKPLLKAKYLDKETGLVPVALLYVQDGIERFKNGILDLSMVSSALIDQVQEYFAGLVFARAA